jgi:hypothetical protein
VGLKGKPYYRYPYGFFSFSVTDLVADPQYPQTVTVTVTLPGKAPVGTKWVKYQNGQWSILDIGDDDGDNVITYQVTDGGTGDADGVVDGTIIEPGAPAFPLLGLGVGGEVNGIGKINLILPWLVLGLAIVSGGGLWLWSRRKKS